mgnify:FL=1
MLGAFLGDVVGGFTKQSDTIRKDNMDRQQRQDDREQEIMLAIANSPDVRPETRSAAVTGLLTRRPGKSTGFDKWFGKHEQNPVFSQVHAMLGESAGGGMNPSGSAEGGNGPLTGAGGPPELSPMREQPQADWTAAGASGGPGSSGMPSVALRSGAGFEALPDVLPRVLPSRPQGPASTAAPRMGVPAALAKPSGPPPSMFYGPGEREGATVSGQRRGEIDARFGAAKEYGVPLSPGDQSSIITGRAEPRNTAKLISVEFEDGTAGSVLQYQDGTVTSEAGEPLTQRIKRVVPSGNLNAGVRQPTGVTSTMRRSEFYAQFGYMPPGDAPFLKVKIIDGVPTEVIAAQQPQETYSPVQTPGGIERFGNRSGAVSPSPGGAGVQRPVGPETDAAGTRALYTQVETAARAASSVNGVLSRARYQRELDTRAKALGYADFAALAAAAGEKTQGVGGAVPGGSSAAPPVVQPEAARPAAGRGGKPAATAAPRDPVIDQVLSILGK